MFGGDGWAGVEEEAVPGVAACSLPFVKGGITVFRSFEVELSRSFSPDIPLRCIPESPLRITMGIYL